MTAGPCVRTGRQTDGSVKFNILMVLRLCQCSSGLDSVLCETMCTNTCPSIQGRPISLTHLKLLQFRLQIKLLECTPYIIHTLTCTAACVNANGWLRTHRTFIGYLLSGCMTFVCCSISLFHWLSPIFLLHLASHQHGGSCYLSLVQLKVSSVKCSLNAFGIWEFR